ncbi:hypothetical protein ACQEU3_43195 [Spirillospora sp. CA-253888]
MSTSPMTRAQRLSRAAAFGLAATLAGAALAVPAVAHAAPAHPATVASATAADTWRQIATYWHPFVEQCIADGKKGVEDKKWKQYKCEPVNFDYFGLFVKP